MADRTRKPWSTALAAALGGAAALWLVSARGTEPAGASDAPPAGAAAPARDELRAVQDELARLRAEHARAERRIAELEAASSAAAQEARAGEREHAEATRVTPDQEEPPEQAQRLRAAQTFASEPDDPRWNPDAEIRGLVQAALPAGSTLRSVVCRSSLCRVETGHADEAAQQAFASKLAMPRFETPPTFKAALFDPGERSPDGRELHAVTYLSRPGQAALQVPPEAP